MSTYLQSTEPPAGSRPMTVTRLAQHRARGEKIAMLTCYDASFAALLNHCDVDVLLVGDSLGMVCQGHETTLPVSLADLAYHTACVARSNQHALLVADLPFGAYRSPAETYAQAVTLMQAGAQMVKLEGGRWIADTVRFLSERGVPVCGHLGLMPQSVHQLGGYRIQGRTPESAATLKADALALQDAGMVLLVLEAIPSELGRDITETLRIPTIGIGAGPDCSGQVLVLHDMLDLFPGRKPRFVRNFMDGQSSIGGAISAYVRAVRTGEFPASQHCF